MNEVIDGVLKMLIKGIGFAGWNAEWNRVFENQGERGRGARGKGGGEKWSIC
jgi:hypothetical protein